MEEVSSLDSFHTDGADPAAQNESETPNPDGQGDEAVSNLYESVGDVETEKDVGNEEDFDQISEGSFNLDDSSHATISAKSQKSQNEPKLSKADEEGTPLTKSTEFEEVDANTPAHEMSTNVAEESDMLGESDMTLPLQTAHDESTGGEKSQSTMDVDNEDGGDIEMASPKATDKSNDNENANDPHKTTGKETGESVDNTSIDIDNSKDDIIASESVEDNNEEDEGAGDEEPLQKETDSNEHNENIDQPEDDDEENDERCENVQEPEESDVCLIPDDTESQMTEEEKEQAILARENAEKEDAIAEAEKEKERAAEEAKETETENGEDNIDNQPSAGGAAQADVAGAVAAEPDSGNEENVANADGADPDAEADADADEPSQEDVQDNEGGTGVVSKIIIAWIVSSVHKCKQCGETKTCGYRLKDPELTEPEYVCEMACCEKLLATYPGKYFIRRKKFLVEELPIGIETAAGGATDENATDVMGSTQGKRAERECLQCKETKECQYFFKQDNECFYICNDNCFDLLNSVDPDKFKMKRHSIRVRNIGSSLTTEAAASPAKKTSTSESRVVARTPEQAEAARLSRIASFTRRCAECSTEITLGIRNLLWETMDYCNEVCLGKYQRRVGSECQTCKGEVPHNALGKYCVRFGFDIRQFCCAGCLNEYKKGLKTCSCCQKDISTANEGFLAPVGDKEQFKDFCSQACMRRYDIMCNPKKKLRSDTCAVCNNEKPVRVEIVVDDKECNFCSNPCFSAFKFVSNIVADQCCMCCKYFERKGTESFTIYTERRAKVFCSRICLNVYIIVNRRIVSCQWCKVKKYNFDMIYKLQDAQELLTCSLNCLTLYGVSVSAFSRSIAKCDNCGNSATSQYHLTMSDASIRNFCTYQCVMQFQNQFARAPLTLENDTHQTLHTDKGDEIGPFPTGLPKRVKLKDSQQSTTPMKLPSKGTTISKKSTLPVISTVSSLASGETETMIGNVTVRRPGRGRKLDSPPPLTSINNNSGSYAANARGRQKRPLEYARSPSPASSSSAAAPGKRASSVTMDAGVQGETKIITVPPYPPAVRNMATSCKPQTNTVGIQHSPETESVEIQTDKDYSNKILIPVPVPIYVPQPMYMYSAPFPVPVPIPLPIPVPIFIPTTRNSAQGILKEIKKIQDKMPADPFEAELLMMAEMVAEEKRDSDSDSDDDIIKAEPGAVTIEYGNNVQQVEVAHNSYGEDVLQMALKMATGEYDQPTVDLESAMTVNTITNPPPGMMTHDESSITHMGMQQEPQIMDTQRAVRGRKRGSMNASPRNSRSPIKRSRLQEVEPHQELIQEQIQTLEKPDANMCLKYTFGVNAWKQWVMTKNADIEKSTNPRRRSFKTELLQMTADELNYSLCLFVKEVRKPNGTEYAPDTIYYLVLGIQQYLYENGRIDNIFTDPYYERFTDCLDEVARKFSVLYNDSQYIVTRVEEEHLWECKQLGAHSPHVLLSTLMFFNTKHFNLTTVEEHMQLSFSHIMKHWKRSGQNTKTPGTRNVLLRFYPPQSGLDANPRKKKVYEQQENEENPLRCPVRLYEFYLSKCPESVKTRNDVFYLQPERSCVPDSPVWYSTQPLSQESLQKMLHRVKMVKEINIALLTS